jgi:hypothetical protein
VQEEIDKNKTTWNLYFDTYMYRDIYRITQIIINTIIEAIHIKDFSNRL